MRLWGTVPSFLESPQRPLSWEGPHKTTVQSQLAEFVLALSGMHSTMQAD